MGIKIRLNKVTLSFPHLFEARSIMGGKPKFSASFVLDRTAHKREIDAIQAAYSEVVRADFGGVAPDKKLPMKFGEKKYPDVERFKNTLIINATHVDRPFTVDKLPTQAIMDPGQLYPGCIVNAAIDVYGYKRQTGNGITFGLHGVQFVGDGERLDSKPSVTDLFDEVPDIAEAPSMDGLEEEDEFSWAS